MSGSNAKGTLSLEKNALGINIKLNIFGGNYNDAKLAFCIDGKNFAYGVTEAKSGMKLETMNTLDSIHAAVFDNGMLIMYGTNEPLRFNNEQIYKMLPPKIIKVVHIEEKAEYNKEEEKTQIFSKREDKIILPQTKQSSSSSLESNDKTTFLVPNQSHDSGNSHNIKKEEPDINISPPAIPPIQYIDDAIANANYFELDDTVKPLQNCSTSPSEMSMKYIMQIANSRPLVDVNSNNNTKKETISQSPFTSHKIMNSQNSAISLQPAIEPIIAVSTPSPATQQNVHPDAFAAPPPSLQQENPKPPQPPLQKVAAVDSSPFIQAREGSFFEKQADEIEALFDGQHKREEILEKMLPQSKWVRINFDNSRYYVVGLIGKEFLCYGIPDTYSSQPPTELNGFCWWLPLRADNPLGKGYWIMYQDLKTGEAVLPPT